tara:strand:+ start:43 stop:348 length:306 start_codon:yes stop_codon:yes gene_type:complete
MKIKIEKDFYLIIDRSQINFKNCEFEVLKFSKDGIFLKLTEEGLKQFKENVLNRTEQFGDSNYIIDFVTKELNGRIEYHVSEHEYDKFEKIIKERNYGTSN